MNLIDFARTAPCDQTPEEFVEMLKKVLPLDEIKNLSENEAITFHGVTMWLNDLALLLVEFHQNIGENPDDPKEGPPVPGYNGPFISNCITGGKSLPDFAQLVHFGLEGENK